MALFGFCKLNMDGRIHIAKIDTLTTVYWSYDPKVAI